MAMVGEFSGSGAETWSEETRLYVLVEQSISERQDLRHANGASGVVSRGQREDSPGLGVLKSEKELPWEDEGQDRARGGKKAGG